MGGIVRHLSGFENFFLPNFSFQKHFLPTFPSFFNGEKGVSNKKEEVKSSRNEEESRRINWAIWLPIAVATIGAALWFFIFVILD